MARTSTTAPQSTDRTAGRSPAQAGGWGRRETGGAAQLADLPEHLTAAGMAKHIGAHRGTVLRWVRDGRRIHDATGNWPKYLCPEPDRLDRPAAWRSDRDDVMAFIVEKRTPNRPPELNDREWLLRQYGHPDGADGRPVHPDGLARGMKDIARELRGKYAPKWKPTIDTVRVRMLALDIPVPEDPVRSALAHVPLDVLEAEVLEHGSQEAAAAARGVDHMTLRGALRAKRAAKKAAEAPALKRARKGKVRNG